jgi:hypothetical protein
VDLASLYRRVTRLGRDGSAPRDASSKLTQDEITRAAQKALEKCERENSKWTHADLIANLGRVLPRSAADPDGQARLLEEVAGRAVAGEFGQVVCLEAPGAAPVPASLRRAGWAERVPAARRGQVRDQGAAIPGGAARSPGRCQGRPGDGCATGGPCARRQRRGTHGGVPLEYSIAWLICTVTCGREAVMVGWPGAAQDHLLDISPRSRPRRPGVPQGPGQGG